MKKTLYSLMLSDDVVRGVDELAHRRGLTRSALVNDILAEHTGFVTPERRINDIFGAIEELMTPYRDLVPFFEPNAMTMSLKSSLEYKYRPTVRYEVQLHEDAEGYSGELDVVFRTQSRALLGAMTEFFRLWRRIEDAHLAPPNGARTSYALYDGRFARGINLPAGRSFGSGDIAAALSAYIRLFDDALKGRVSRRYTERDVESRYLAWLDSGNILL